jgi:hypothetical protein
MCTWPRVFWTLSSPWTPPSMGPCLHLLQELHTSQLNKSLLPWGASKEIPQGQVLQPERPHFILRWGILLCDPGWSQTLGLK